jgi:hypothetical protein
VALVGEGEEALNTEVLGIILQELASDGDLGPLIAANRLGVKPQPRFFTRAVRTPVPGVGEIPVRFFAFLIVAFAVVIGPLNLFLFRKGRRRLLILVSIPVLSLVVSAVLLGYALFGEGLSVKVVPRSITYLDQVIKRASHVSKTGYYAGTTPADGLRLPPEASIMEIWAQPEPNDRARRTIELDEGIKLDGGWLPVRTPREFLVTAARAWRERVEIGERDGNTLAITNGTSVRLLEFLVCTPDGTLFAATDVGPGEGALATRVPGEARLDIQTVVGDDLYESWSGSQDFKSLASAAAPPAGEYLALTDVPLVADYGFDAPKVLRGMNLLRGRYMEVGR